MSHINNTAFLNVDSFYAPLSESKDFPDFTPQLIHSDIKKQIASFYSLNSCLMYPIASILREIDQQPTPEFLSWNNRIQSDLSKPQYNFRRRKKRFWKLIKLLNQLEEQSSLICPFCEVENYSLVKQIQKT